MGNATGSRGHVGVGPCRYASAERPPLGAVVAWLLLKYRIRPQTHRDGNLKRFYPDRWGPQRETAATTRCRNVNLSWARIGSEEGRPYATSRTLLAALATVALLAPVRRITAFHDFPSASNVPIWSSRSVFSGRPR